MNKSKKITITLLGIMGVLMYYKREVHRWYFENVEGKPI